MAKYKLNDIAPIQQGDVPIADKYWLLNLDMVESNTGKVIDYMYCDESEIGNSTVKFDTRNVLYSKLRPYLNKVVIPEKAGYATSEMLPMRPNPEIVTREYLTYYLRSPSFVSYIKEKTSGAKMPRANSSDLKDYLIECPELSVQQRITAQFDMLVSILDGRKIELDKLDELVKARFVEMFGSIKSNDKGWDTVQLKDIADVRGRVGWKGYKKEDLRESGPLVLGATHLTDSGELDLSAPVYLSREKYEESPEIVLQKNDLIFTQRGNTIGKVGLVAEDIGEATINPCVLILRPLNIHPVYFKTYFVMDETKDDMWMLNSGSAQPMITQKGIGEYQLMIPPIEIQNQFAEFVKQVDKSKVAVQKALDETQTLFDSLMQEYFG